MKNKWKVYHDVMDAHFSAHILAVNTSGEFLLVKRKDVPIWVIPGGKAEKGEKPLQTAVREFYEETGVLVNDRTIKLVAHYLPAALGKRHKFTFITTLEGNIHPIITDESSDYGFFSLNKLPEPISVYEYQRILDATSNKKNILKKIDTVNFYLEFKKLSSNPLRLIVLFSKYFWTKMASFSLSSPN